MAIDAAIKPVELGGARAWFVWALAVAFVVYYFSFQTGYAIVNPSVGKDIGLSATQVATCCGGLHLGLCAVPVFQRRLVGPIRCWQNHPDFDRIGDDRHIRLRQCAKLRHAFAVAIDHRGWGVQRLRRGWVCWRPVVRHGQVQLHVWSCPVCRFVFFRL